MGGELQTEFQAGVSQMLSMRLHGQAVKVETIIWLGNYSATPRAVRPLFFGGDAVCPDAGGR